MLYNTPQRQCNYHLSQKPIQNIIKQTKWSSHHYRLSPQQHMQRDLPHHGINKIIIWASWWCFSAFEWNDGYSNARRWVNLKFVILWSEVTYTMISVPFSTAMHMAKKFTRNITPWSWTVKPKIQLCQEKQNWVWLSRP